MQIIDVPNHARITRVTPTGQDPAPAESSEYVLMTREAFDALVVRVLVAEADPANEAMQLVAAAAAG